MMRGLAKFTVSQPVVANLVVFACIAAGIVFGLSLRKEFFPEVRPSVVAVTAPYPGASPEEIEDSLALKIEDAVDDLDGIDEIITTITDSLAVVSIEFEDSVRIEDAVADVKRRVDAMQDLPEEAERITVREVEPNLPAITLTIAGDAGEKSLKRAARQIERDLLSLDGMGDISISGIRTDEITVSIDPMTLVRYNLSFTDVSRLVSDAMTELPAGNLKSSTENIVVRTVGVDERASAVRDIVLRADPDGSAVTLGDVATVTDGFADVDFTTRFNGRPCISLIAFKVGDEDAVLIADMVRAYHAGRTGEPYQPTLSERLVVALTRAEEPTGGRYAAYKLGRDRLLNAAPLPGDLYVHNDLSRFITGRLDLLTRNAVWGGVIVFLMLLFFLNVRVAFWVIAGLAVAVFGTLASMYFLGVTLNLLSMFGLIVVLGLLVDDAIVVAENILARHERGEPALASAVSGMTLVAWPVVGTVLTTIFAFSSLMLLEGQIGDLMSVLPKVVTIALAMSLVEALFILPSHMGHSLLAADRVTHPGPLLRIFKWTENLGEGFIDRVLRPAYTPLTNTCVRHRYLTLAVALSCLVVALGAIAGGRPAFNFLGDNDAETILTDIRMPVGTPASATERIVKLVEQAAVEQPEIKHINALIGFSSNPDGTGSRSQPHVAQIYMELLPVEQREQRGMRSSEFVIDAIREAAGPLPGVESFRMEGLSGGPSGADLAYVVTAQDPSLVQPVANQIADLLEGFEGVSDIADDADQGRPEFQIDLLPGAAELGFTRASLARQIRATIFGLEAHTFSAPNEDVDVRVIADTTTRRSLANIEQMYVFAPATASAPPRPVPLAEVATLREVPSYATINRLDEKRAVTVSAQVAKTTSPESIAQEIAGELRELERRYPGITVEARGRQQQVAESFASLPLGMLATCILIYINLAWLLQSYVKPLAILLLVPFSIVGAVAGHLLMGYDITILSMIGFVALSGVVVNDAIVFVEFYKHRREEGMSPIEAAIDTGPARLRAIFLTTITTVGGLAPLLTEQSFQARFLIPMAITICFGLLSATFVVLLVLPSILVIGDDVRKLAVLAWTGHEATDTLQEKLRLRDTIEDTMPNIIDED